MPDYVYDDATRTLVVTHDGREIYRVANLPETKVKETLQAFVVKGDDGQQFAFVDEVGTFEAKPAIDDQVTLDEPLEPKLINPVDCTNKECPMRTESVEVKGVG
jgi:hypothetical protein